MNRPPRPSYAYRQLTMPKVAVAEDAVAPAVVDCLRELGYGIWFLPKGDPEETERLLQDFPPDVVILPDRPETEAVASSVRDELPSIRVLVAVGGVRVPTEIPDWADLAIAADADLTFWMLAMMAVAPLDRPAGEAPGRGRQTLFTIIDAAHRGLRSIELEASSGNRVLADLRGRLEKSFELLLRIMLDQLEREIEGYSGHSARVSELSRRLAQRAGLPREDLDTAALAGLLHDLGMHLVVPEDALTRPGALHKSEWEVVRAHPAASALAISPLRSAPAAVQAIREHHERLDGSGYPVGKKGDDISVIGRIVAVADAYEAMTHPRPHRPALSTEQAFEVLLAEGRAGRMDLNVCMALGAVVPAERPMLRAVQIRDLAGSSNGGTGASRS